MAIPFAIVEDFNTNVFHYNVIAVLQKYCIYRNQREIRAVIAVQLYVHNGLSA